MNFARYHIFPLTITCKYLLFWIAERDYVMEMLRGLARDNLTEKDDKSKKLFLLHYSIP